MDKLKIQKLLGAEFRSVHGQKVSSIHKGSELMETDFAYLFRFFLTPLSYDFFSLQ